MMFFATLVMAFATNLLTLIHAPYDVIIIFAGLNLAFALSNYFDYRRRK